MRAILPILLALTALAACSSNSSSSTASGGTSTGGAGGGTTCGAFGAALGVGTATDPCAACMFSSCRAEFVAAFGSDGKTPGGACKGYWDCVCACPSGSTTCAADCAPQIDPACEAAQSAFSDCMDAKCTAACE